MDFRYEIGGKVYFQKELVWGQIKQLTGILGDLEIPKEFNLSDLIFSLGDKLPMALACVLIEEGTSLQAKDLQALSVELEFSLTPEILIEVIEDFLACNRVSSIVENLTGLARKISLTMINSRLTGSSASSAGETSPEGMPSSGDSPPGSPAPSLNS